MQHSFTLTRDPSRYLVNKHGKWIRKDREKGGKKTERERAVYVSTKQWEVGKERKEVGKRERERERETERERERDRERERKKRDRGVCTCLKSTMTMFCHI